MMNPREVVEAVLAGQVLLVHVGTEENYEEQHFSSAIRAYTDEELLALPRDKPIWLYCT